MSIYVFSCGVRFKIFEKKNPQFEMVFLWYYTQYIWDSLNGTLDKIGHGTWDNVYWVTKN